MKRTYFWLIILGCCILALGHSATASAGVKNATTLCIENKDGSVLKFYLSERPKIIFKGNYTIEHGVNDWGHSTPVGTINDYKNNTGNGTFAGSATSGKPTSPTRTTQPD